MLSTTRMHAAMAVVISLMFLGHIPAEAQTNDTIKEGDRTQDPPNFLERVIELNRAQVQMAHLGMMRAQNMEVREFAKTMVVDHSFVLLTFENARPKTDNTSTPDEVVRIEDDSQKPREMPTPPNRTELTAEHKQAV